MKKEEILTYYDDLYRLALSKCADCLSADEEAAVRRELNYLAKTLRAVLVRYYYYGQSVQEIAKDLKIPEGTVKSRLSARLDQTLGDGLCIYCDQQRIAPE